MSGDDRAFWLVQAFHLRTHQVMSVGVFTTEEAAEAVIAKMKQRNAVYHLWASWIQLDPNVVAVAEEIRWKMRPEDE